MSRRSNSHSLCRLRTSAPIAAFAWLAACSPAPPSPSPSDKIQPRPLIVSVAASTTDSMQRLADRFHAESGVELKLNAGSSNGLATQILAGAPAEVFLSASREWADKIDAAGYAAARVDLLTNRLVVVVPRGNPAGVQKPEDLSSAAVKKLALAGENVPAGMYADQALSNLGLIEPLTAAGKIVRGQDVRAALSYIERGEAEVAIVYASDLRAAAGVELAFEFDPALHEKIVYVLVLVKHDPANPAASQFYDFLRTADAQQVFAELGFVPLDADDTP